MAFLWGLGTLLRSARGAFAAILEDGTVATWGDAKRGGDCGAVRKQLRGVQSIEASKGGGA